MVGHVPAHTGDTEVQKLKTGSRSVNEKGTSFPLTDTKHAGWGASQGQGYVFSPLYPYSPVPGTEGHAMRV